MEDDSGLCYIDDEIARLRVEVERLTQEASHAKRASQFLYDLGEPEAGHDLYVAVECLVASRKRDKEMLERWAIKLDALRTLVAQLVGALRVIHPVTGLTPHHRECVQCAALAAAERAGIR